MATQAETNLMRRIQVALSEIGCTTWRNEVAGGWVGKRIHKDDRTVVLQGAQFMNFGLCNGSSDLIGIAPDGRFLAVEVKTKKGKKLEDQVRYIEVVKAKGGRAGFARSIEDAINIATAPLVV